VRGPGRADRLFCGLFSRFYSHEELIPSMMLTRRCGAPAWKDLVQQMDVRNQTHIHPSPIRKRSTTGPADLVGEKLDGTVVNPIIVGFHNTRFVPVQESN
jgi:hypothetical protein